METIKLWENVPGLCEETPVLEYYPAEDKKTTATVIICPGGAYFRRAPHEGKGYAEFFNSIGMDAFVCEYRVNRHKFPLPLLDVRRAFRYVRQNAQKYGVDPERIAVMGSSAGGHLAALVSTYTDKIDASLEGIDETDNFDYKPNATILCYPVIHRPDETGVAHVGSFINLVGEGNSAMYPSVSCDELVAADTPMAFIWHTSDDEAVNVINSYLYAAALRKNNVPCELHVFPHGRHGLGLAKVESPYVAIWSELLHRWLIENGWFN